jgi:Ion channel
MPGQLIIGLAVSLLNIAVHAIIMTPMSSSAHRTLRSARSAHPQLRLALVMMTTVTVLMAAHLIEIGMWALVYAVLEATPKQIDAFYFAFVNYTTLGYGDILPVAHWRVLGPTTAMNGVLLFGWSTAVIFHVLSRAGPIAPQEASERGGEDANRIERKLPSRG